MTERKTRKTDQVQEAAVDANVEAGEAETTLEPVQLTIADLSTLAAIVDLASRRGAFQGGELTQVGAAYDKLAAFLNYVKSQQETAEGEEAEAEASEAAE